MIQHHLYVYIQDQMINFVDSRGASGEQLQNTQVYWKGEQPFFFSILPLLSFMKKGKPNPHSGIFLCVQVSSQNSTDQKLGEKMPLFGEIL